MHKGTGHARVMKFIPPAVLTFAFLISALSAPAIADLNINDIKPAPVRHRPIHALVQRNAPPETITVSQAAGSKYKTITSALDRIATGGTITVEPGTYIESIVLNEPVTLQTYPNASAGTVIVESATKSALVSDGHGAIVRGISFRAVGHTANPAQALIDISTGDLTLVDSTIGPAANTCVAIRGRDTIAHLKRCHIEQGGEYGVDVTDYAQPTIDQCGILCGGVAGLHIGANGAPTVTQCRIVGGVRSSKKSTDGIAVLAEAGASGIIEASDIGRSGFEAVRILGGSLKLSSCHIHDASGAGIDVIGAASTPSFASCDIHNCDTGLVCDRASIAACTECTALRMKHAGYYAVGGASATFDGCSAGWCGSSGFVVYIARPKESEVGCSAGWCGSSGFVADGAFINIKNATIHDIGGNGILGERKGGITLSSVNIAREKGSGVLAGGGGNLVATDCAIDGAWDGIELHGVTAFIVRATLTHCRNSGILVGWSKVVITTTAVRSPAVDGLDVEGSPSVVADYINISGAAKSGILGKQCVLKLTNCTIDSTGGNAIELYATQASISLCTIDTAVQNGILCARGTVLAMDNSSIAHATDGILCKEHGSVRVSNSSFAHNTKWAIDKRAGRAAITDCTFDSNGAGPINPP